MATATLIARDNITYAGPANHYQLDPPLRGFEHVMVYMEPAYGGASPRVVISPKRMDDEPMLNVPLPGSVSLHHDATIDEAAWFALLAAGGYDIVIPPEPIPGESGQMPILSDKLTDGAKLGVGAEIVFTVRDIRDSVAHDAILGPARTTVPVNASTGLFTSPVLDPGPYWVGIRWSRYNPTHEIYPVEVPAESGTFRWPLIDAGAPPPEPSALGFVRDGGGVTRIQALTQNEYDDLDNPDPATLFIITDSQVTI